MVELVCGLEQRKKLETLPLSNDMICSRIVDFSFNILKNITEELAALLFLFSMQLDETTDISQRSQLVFVRYVHADAIKEEFLFCVSLLETTKTTDIWDIAKKKISGQNFDWKEKLHALKVLSTATKVNNFIRSRSLDHRIFKTFC